MSGLPPGNYYIRNDASDFYLSSDGEKDRAGTPIETKKKPVGNNQVSYFFLNGGIKYLKGDVHRFSPYSGANRPTPFRPPRQAPLWPTLRTYAQFYFISIQQNLINQAPSATGHR